MRLGSRRRRVSANRLRLGLTRLEDRTVPTTFTVLNTNDSGPNSLRQAILDANDAPDYDTIMFDPGFFSVPRTILLTSDPLRIRDGVTIAAPGPGLVTISGNNERPIMEVTSTTSNRNVNISGVTITGGVGQFDLRAGAIQHGYCDLSLVDCVISGNRSYPGPFGHGGGISCEGGSLSIQRCTVSNNIADLNEGGGIALYNTDAAIIDCAVVGNAASLAGGGIRMLGGSLNLVRSTVAGNVTTDGGGEYIGGGGIACFSTLNANGLVIVDSTISSNHGLFGGGVLLLLEVGDVAVAIRNSTIAGNTAAANTSAGGLDCRAVEPSTSINVITLESTLVAGNSVGGTMLPKDLNFEYLGVFNGDNNLIGAADIGNFVLTGVGNLTGTSISPLNPMLGALAYNGGPTQTRALLPGSPAINAGNNLAGFVNDQRGPGFPRVVNGMADIGAFEVQGAPMVASTRVNDGSAQRSRVRSLLMTFDTIVTFGGAVADAFTLARNGGKPVSFSASASIVNGVTVVTITNFNGASTQFGSLADGRYTLTALASQISANGQQMTGNYTFGEAEGLFRFFGDINGDRHVDIADYGLFSVSYLNQANYNAAFDFNGDGHVDILDYGQFGLRYLRSLP